MCNVAHSKKVEIMVSVATFDYVLGSVCSCEKGNLCYWHDQVQAKGRTEGLLMEMREYLECMKESPTEEQFAEMQKEWEEYQEECSENPWD